MFSGEGIFRVEEKNEEDLRNIRFVGFLWGGELRLESGWNFQGKYEVSKFKEKRNKFSICD